MGLRSRIAIRFKLVLKLPRRIKPYHPLPNLVRQKDPLKEHTNHQVNHIDLML